MAFDYSSVKNKKRKNEKSNGFDYSSVVGRTERTDEEKREYVKQRNAVSSPSVDELRAAQYAKYQEDERNRLKTYNIKEARDKKYSLEQQLKSIGGTTSQIVSSSIASRGKTAYDADRNAEIKKLKDEISRLNNDIENAKAIQDEEYYNGFIDRISASKDFEQLSQIGRAKYQQKVDSEPKSVIETLFPNSEKVKEYSDWIGDRDIGSKVSKANWEEYTEEEKNLYGYILEKYPDKADDFLLRTNERIEREKRENLERKAIKMGEDNSVVSAVGALGANILSPVDYLSGLQQMGYTKHLYGEASMIEPGINMTRFASSLNEGVTNAIEDSTDFEIGGVNAASFLYGTGMSVANSALLVSTMGPAAAGVMSLQAASSTTMDALDRGLTDEQAVELGAAAGIAEYLGEKMSIEHFFKFKDIRTARQAVKHAAAQAGIEASEEAMTTVINTIADFIISGDKSEYATNVAFYLSEGKTQKEAEGLALADAISGLIQDTIGGAISGFAFGSAGVAINSFSRNQERKAEAKKTVKDFGEDKQPIIDYAMKAEEGSEVRKAAEDIKARMEKGETVSDKEFADILIKADDSFATAEIKKQIAYEAKTNNETYSDEELGQMSTSVLKTMRGDLISESENAQIEKSKAARNVYARNTGREYTYGEAVEKAEMEQLNKNEHRRKMEELVSEQSDAFKKTLSATYESYKESGAQNILDEEEFADHFSTFYDFGKAGIESVDKIFEAHPAMAKNPVLKNALEQAYVLGKGEVEAENIAQSEIKQAAVKKGVKGKIVFESDAKGMARNKQQTATIELIDKVLAKASGIEYHIFASYLKDGKRYYKDSKGNEVLAPNGFDVIRGREIWVDLNAGREGQGIMLYTLTHEHLHDIRVWSPEHYNNLLDIARETFEADGKDFGFAVKEKYDSYHKSHPDYTVDDAKEEVVADMMSGLLTDENGLREFSKQIRQKDQTLWDKIKDWFADVIARIVKAYEGLKPESYEARMLMENKALYEKAQKVFAEAVVAAGQNYKNAGIEIDVATESVAPSVMFSERTWSESEYVKARNETARAIASELDVSLDKAYDYIDSVNSVAKAIADDRARLDYDPNLDEHATVLKPNSEYGVTVDMSTLCAKRLLFTGTFDAIQKRMPNVVFDSEDIVNLRKMMMDRGYEVACGICYVESTRREMGRITQEFIDKYKEAQSTGKPITRTNSEGKVVELKKTKEQMKSTADKSTNRFYADKDYTPTLADLNTTDIDLVKINHPLVYEAYLNFMNARGQSKPKLLETRAEYKGEILKYFKQKKTVNKKNFEGGLRLQSFSDFELPHLIDMMQIVMDMSRVGLKSQAYTKVPKFAEAFGGTGIKINLSLIAKGSGVDENGNLVFDDIEGINHKEAFRIRDKFSRNVGTILVGKSDEHIRAAMADPRIDMIIPFHKSSWKESLYEALGLTGYTDYTSDQTEKPFDKSRGKLPQFHSDEYWDYSKSGDENAQIYLQKCREDGRTPVFPQFQNEPGYWKMLIDFKMYDNDGVGAPHEVVRPIFDDDYNAKILNEYKGGHRKLPVAQDVVDDFVKEYDTGTKFQDRDSDVDIDAQVNMTRAWIDNIEDRLSDPFFAEENPKAANELRAKLESLYRDLRGELAEVRKQTKKTSIKTILENLEYYSDLDIEGLANDISENNWDFKEEGLSRAEIIEGIREMLEEKMEDMSPLEQQSPKFGFYVRPVNKSKDIRYSLREVAPVQPSSDKWQRTSTTSEVMARFPDLWNVAAEESETRNPTQITGTVKSYRKIYDFLKNEEFDGKILDASSGLGYGTKAGIEEYGFDVEDIEPYPDKSYHPKYKDYSKLHKTYDVIISNAVLNVIPQDQRDALVVKMGELLNEGGRMFINVRGKDVENASSKVAINSDLMEYYISNTGSYQKGFTKSELVAYLQDALGNGYDVKATNMFGAVSAVVTKETDIGRKIKNQDRLDSATENRIIILEDQIERLENDIAEIQRHYDKAQDYARAEGVLIGQVEQGKEMAKTIASKDAELRRRKESFERKAKNYEDMIEAKRAKIKEIRQRRDEILAERAEAYRKYKEQRSESIKGGALRKRIERNAKTLGDWLLKNSDKEHIPEALKTTVGEFLTSIDFTSKRALGGGEETKKDNAFVQRLNSIATMLENQRKYMSGLNEGSKVDNAIDAYLDLPEGFAEEIRKLADDVSNAALGGDFVINEMNSEQLAQLDKMLRVLKTSIGKMNKLLANAHFASATAAAESSMRELAEYKNHKLHGKNIEQANAMLEWGMFTPVYAFGRYGKAGASIFEGIQKGWNDFAFAIKKILNFTNATYTDKEVSEWGKEVHTVTLASGKEIKITTAQLMSFYCLLKREQARGHIFGGGVRIADIAEGKEKIQQTDNFLISEEDVQTLYDELTPRQIDVANKLQKFMTEQGSEWGNKVSMERFGYRAFTEENYFPIETDDNNRIAIDPEAKANDMFRLLNMSATKGLVKGANNALVVSDIFDVFSNHMSDMAKYGTLALPILDTMKWYNYKVKYDQGNGQFTTETVQKSVERVYGSVGKSYFTNFMKDLNGVREGGRGTNFLNKLTSNYKVAAVGFNLRTAALQPTSIIRALNVIERKYLVGTMHPLRNAKEAEKYSGIALWKSLGFYNTDIARGIREQIKGGEPIDKIRDKSMWFAEQADRATWGILWNAAKLKAKDQGFKGEELNRKAAEIFDEIIYKTQVVDSTLTRSELMRNKNINSFTAFMAEPTISYNMVADSVFNIRREKDFSTGFKKYGNTFARSASVYMLSTFITSAVQSIADAMRDDDDDETAIEKFWQAFYGEKFIDGNFVAEFNPLEKLPFVRDAFSILRGYSNERMETSAISSLVKACGIIWETYRVEVRGEKPTATTYYGKMTGYGKVYATAKAISQLSGLPFSNAMREGVTLWNLVIGNMAPSLKLKTYDDSKKK